jgi:hypothetical protein
MELFASAVEPSSIFRFLAVNMVAESMRSKLEYRVRLVVLAISRK